MKGTRVHLPAERESITHRFRLGDSKTGIKVYLVVGLLPDGQPGEIFLNVGGRNGSMERGLLRVLAITASMALQHGVPLRKIMEKWRHEAFEPAGRTDNSRIPLAVSLTDYVARWLGEKFL